MTRHRADRRAFVATVATGMLLMGTARRRPVPAARLGARRAPGLADRLPHPLRGVATRDHARHAREAAACSLGYVEGRDLKFEIRAANEDFERLPDLAADLVRSGVDLIVAVSSPAIRAAENTTSTIPIVMLSGTDPVAGLFVASLAHPEGNVTGLTTYVPELAGKRLELLRECVPDLRRVAILANLRNPSSAVEVREMETAARALSIEIHVQDARLPEQYPNAFMSVARAGWRALVVTADPVLSSNRERILQLAARHRPAHHVRVEGDRRDRRAHVLWPEPGRGQRPGRGLRGQDLKGASPAALPVERPTRFEPAVNLKTAASLGLKFPAALVARADRVVK